MAEPEPEIEGNISNNMPKSTKRLGNAFPLHIYIKIEAKSLHNFVQIFFRS